jgi:hypothetical protein
VRAGSQLDVVLESDIQGAGCREKSDGL